MKYDVVINNGLVCTESGMFFGGLGIKDGIIQSLLPSGSTFEATKIYDANNNIIFPGVVEPHSHLGLENMTNERFAQDLRTETRAAAQGGITTLNTTTLFGVEPIAKHLDSHHRKRRRHGHFL